MHSPWLPPVVAPQFENHMLDPQLDGVFPQHKGFLLEFADGSSHWLDEISVKLLTEALTLPRDSRGNPLEEDDDSE